jgi:glycerol-3-phosphate dehydrogenase subunit C
VAAADRPRAEKLAQVVRDPSEFLWELREDPRFNKNFASHPESVAYHAACHLRAQAIGLRGRDLIRRTGPKSLSVVAECCGHDGTYAMKVESFDASRRIGGKSFEGLKASGAETWVTDCPLAAVQIEQHAGKKPLHPMTVLARSYRGDPFPGNDDDQGT